jgi:hypothetical protein
MPFYPQNPPVYIHNNFQYCIHLSVVKQLSNSQQPSDSCYNCQITVKQPSDSCYNCHNCQATIKVAHNNLCAFLFQFFSDSCQKIYLPHFCTQFPFHFWMGKCIYKPPTSEPNWSEQQVLSSPLLHPLLLIPLLGTEEAQQCRK